MTTTILGSERFRRGVALAALVVWASYLAVRLVITLPGANAFAFWLLFFAEAFTLISLALFAFDTWRLRDPQSPTPRSEMGLTTDIAIATFDEPQEILEPTLVASLRVREVKDVWVLDDGNRPWLASLAEQLGVRYLTRSGNEHAKAGNLNNAIPRFTSDLVVFLDADHVPQRRIIERLVPYFADPQVGVVQSPHRFRNLDSAQHRRTDIHEQSLFFDVIMPGRDRHDAAFWCGSAAMLRVEALRSIGGVPTDTLSEDLDTSVRLHQEGYISRYHNEYLVSGLAPHTLSDFLLQRDRWARGTLAVLTSARSPLWAKGWSRAQRTHYWNSFLFYILSLQNIAFVLSLLGVALFAALPVGILPIWLLGLAILGIVSTSLAGLALGRGRTGIGDGHMNSWLTSEIHIRALLDLILRRKSRFRVTSKVVTVMTLRQRLRLVRLPLAAFVLLLVAWLLRSADQWGMTTNSFLALPGSLDRYVYFAMTGFLFLELLSIGVFLRRELARKQRRLMWRFPVNTTASIDGGIVPVEDIHESGIGWRGNPGLSAHGQKHQLLLPVIIDGEVNTCRGSVTTVRIRQDSKGVNHYGGIVKWAGDDDRRNMLDHCYVQLSDRSPVGDGGVVVQALDT